MKIYLDAINILKENNYNIIVVEQVEGSIGLEELSFQPSEKIALIFGNEINGVDEKLISLANKCIEIPQFGTKHSLNISVSVGIVVWELFNKMYY